MRKIKKEFVDSFQGGSACHHAASAITGFGGAVLSVPVTPLNIALGIVCVGVGLLSLASCK